MRSCSFVIFLVILLVGSTQQAFGGPTISSSKEAYTVFQLLEKQQELDGTTITFSGEVIGQPIHDKKGVFVNVMDHEFNALGVYLNPSDLSQLKHFGRYSSRGDYIQVTGVFHKICLQHGGDTDLHATTVTIKKPGEAIPEKPITPVKWVISLLLPFLVLFLYLSKQAPNHHKAK